MNDEVGVGVLEGVEELAGEAEAGGEGEAARAAIVEQRGSVHKLEDEVRQVAGADAGVEELGDVGVVEAGEDLLFALEALEQGGGGEGGVEELDGGAHVGLAVDAAGEPDGAHAATAEFALEFPRSEAEAGGEAEGDDGGLAEESVGAGRAAEQRLSLAEGIRVGGEMAAEEGEALGFRQVEGGGQGVVEELPIAGGHRGSGLQRLKLVEEPETGDGPVAFDGGWGEVKDPGGFLDGEVGEVAEFDDAGLEWIDGLEAVEGGVEGEEGIGVFVPGAGGGRGLVEGYDLTAGATLGGGTAAGAGDEDLAHQVASDVEEVFGVFGFDGALAVEFEVEVVDEGGGAGAVGFAADEIAGQTVEIAVHEGDEVVESRAITRAQPLEQGLQNRRIQLP